MEVFINELSLNNQYYDDSTFESSVKELNAIFYLLGNTKKDFRIYKSCQLLYAKTLKNSLFISSIRTLRDKSLKESFTRIVFNRLNAADWENERVHNSADYYFCNVTKKDIANSSIAEVAERNIRNKSKLRLLVNFIESEYKGIDSVIVTKNRTGKVAISLSCVDSVKNTNQWLEKSFKLSKFKYNYDLNKRPTINQTILIDKKKFVKTNLKSQGSSVYKEIETNRFWYPDKFHKGEGSHLEVFDHNGNHVGEASLEGIIDYKKKDPKKHLRLNK